MQVYIRHIVSQCNVLSVHVYLFIYSVVYMYQRLYTNKITVIPTCSVISLIIFFKSKSFATVNRFLHSLVMTKHKYVCSSRLMLIIIVVNCVNQYISIRSGFGVKVQLWLFAMILYYTHKNYKLRKSLI